MPEVNMDFIGKQGQQGDVAGIIANGRLDAGSYRPYIYTDPKTGKTGMYKTIYKGGDPKKLSSYAMQPVNNATLRRDEWKQLDEAVLAVAEQRLGGFQDLIDKGLTFNLGNAMGTTVLEWHDVSDAMEADLSMDGLKRGQNDRPKYNTNYLPIPIVHVDYEINSRVLSASRNMGNPLDTTSAERAARKVNEKLESMLFTSTTYSFGGGTIYSYLNHPDRNQVTLSTNWDDISASSSQSIGEQIIDDVIAMKQQAINNHYYGPFMIYIPTNYETLMDKDYDTSGASTQTIRQRIEAINNIEGVKVVDTLPDDNVLMVQMTSDVVRLVRGMGIQNVEWSNEGGMVTNYKVMTIQVPQIRSDQEGNSGIIHLA